MSRFSDIFDNIYVRLEALWPDKTEITYPYSLVDNAEQFLRDGYGLKVGTGGNSDLSTDYLHTVDRAFSVVLSREAYDLSTKNGGVKTATKALFDDMHDLKNDLLDLSRVDPMFGGEEIVYINDGGLEEVATGEKRFLALEVFFNFEITQQINQ